MAFEPNNFSVARKIALPKSQVNVECNSSLTDEITKVLSVSGQACVSSCEVLAGTVNYAGYVDLCVVYLTSDGEIGKVNSNCPFSSKFTGEAIENGQKCHISLRLLDCEVQSISQDVLKGVCTIEEECYLFDNHEIKSIKCVDEDVCSKNETIKVESFVGATSGTANVTSEFNLREQVKRIVMTESQVLVKNVESGNNFVSISGEVVSRVLYLTENDKFESGYVYDGFKEELELDGATSESHAEAYASVKRDSINVTLDQDEKGGKITLQVPIEISVKAYNTVEIEVVKDIYSTKSELGITTSSFDMSCVCASSTIEGKIDGSLTLDDDKPRVDKIMFVGGNNVVITNAYIKDEEIVLEGIAKSSVVYLNDEDSSLNAVALEVPFVLTDKCTYDFADGQLNVDAIVCDVDVVVKKGRELFYDARVKANVNFCHDEVSGVITEIVNQEQLPQRDYAMELIFGARGQDSWELAKQARVREDMLLAQNPEVVFPLEEDQNLVLFFQKKY